MSAPEGSWLSTAYHPDPIVNLTLIAEANEGERADLEAGYPPKRWRCPCGAEHSRGYVPGSFTLHRCLACGYIGELGVLLNPPEELA